MTKVWDQFGGAGAADRQFAFNLGTDKKLFFGWYNDGGSYSGTAGQGTVALSYGDEDVFWVRAEFDADDGAGHYTVTFKHRVADDDAWTTIETITGGATSSLQNPDGLDSRLSVGPEKGVRIYRVRLFDQLDPAVGPLPCAPIDWFDHGSTSNTATFGGSPVVTLRNGSFTGSHLDNYLDVTGTNGYFTAWNVMFFDTDEGITVCGVSLGHNQHSAIAFATPGQFEAGLESVFDEFEARFPTAGRWLIAQNPNRASDSQLFADRQALMQAKVMSVAARGDTACLNAYQAFLDDAGFPATLMADQKHPSAAGYQFWADLMWSAYEARSI
jgi:lysophospholipase L1-like esterase